MTSYKWRRRQNILKILSLASITLSAISFLITVISYLRSQPNYNGLSPFVGLLITIFFIIIFYLNQKKLTKIASASFISFYFLLNSYFVWRWSASLPMPIILYALIIILTGILLGTKISLLLTIATSVIILGATQLQINGLINPDIYWKANDAQISDKIPEIIILMIIFSVIWLYNKEIKKSFRETNLANFKLVKERGLLAIKVAEKEKEIKELHLQKISDIYKLAEIGKNSSAIFHDLMNPLTAVSLNLQQIKDTNSQSYLKDALIATEKMEKFILAIRQHIKQESFKQYFCLNEEIDQVLQIMHHRLIKNNIKIRLIIPKTIRTYGSRHKFSQIILNLLSNAIDSYDNLSKKDKDIKLSLLLTDDNNIKLSIRDNGCGIDPKNINKIWDMFFSTKNSIHAGSGIGLAAIKRIAEKDFHGQITVKSKLDNGTKFVCCFPKKHAKQ